MRRIKLIFAFVLIFSICTTFFSVSAAEYDYTCNGDEKVYIPKTYEYLYSLNTIKNEYGDITHMDQPSSMMIGRDGYLYIADTGNNRIIRLSKAGETSAIFTVADDIKFDAPQGVYGCEDGSIYVADTGNHRIVHLDSTGKCLKVFGLPETSMLSNVSVYSPTKVAPDPKGGLYILMGETIMSVNENNEFQSFIGQTDIGFNFVDWFLRKVASDSQKNYMAKRTASNYISFCLGYDGMLYTTSFDSAEGEIKALNSVGINTYRKYGTIDGEVNLFNNILSKFFSGNTISKSFRFGEIVDSEKPTFSGITVDKDEIVTVIEKQNGKLYQYDKEGNLLTVFGGLGNSNGKFGRPIDITVDDDGIIYVLDQSLGNIQVFEPTKFIKNIKAASTAYYDGDYDKAETLWNETIKTDNLYPLAYYQLGKISHKKGDFKEAMDMFEYSNDRAAYSKAFTEYRYKYMQDHFGAIIGIIAAIVILLGLSITFLLKKSYKVLHKFEYYEIEKLNLIQGIWLGVSLCFHPIRSIQSLKDSKRRLNFGSVGIFVVLMILVRILFIYTVHYPLQDVELYNVSLIREIAKLLLPVLSWSVASYMISSQIDGEATFTETLAVNIYCFTPYVFITTIVVALSQIISNNENSLFAFLVNGVVVLGVIYMVRAIMILNDYKFGKTVIICLASILVMILLWFVVILGFTLIQSIVYFIKDIVVELIYSVRGAAI